MADYTHTKRIAKNTFLLYIRSLIIMTIAIYTSRVLLATLGVQDYGTYSVVGGVVAMFSSIKSVLASAVQRFLNYEKGKGDIESVRNVFNTSIYIHVLLAIIFGLLAELFGIWFINNQLVFPPDSMTNVFFVFHTSVLASIITIITIPYDSLVIANEDMSFYAWISIIETVLKLLIIYLLPIFTMDNLQSYALLMLMITVLLRFISVLYCRRFEESKITRKIDKTTLREMLSFSGWNFFGCTASSLIEEGSNFILNFFGGVIANAARGIAYQVKSAVTILSSNVVVASQPFITQQSAVVSNDRFFIYIYKQSIVLFAIIALTITPIYVYCDYILSLWLEEIPLYTSEFIKAILLYNLVLSFSKSIDLCFKSYAKIKMYQLVDAFIITISLPISYFLLRKGAPLYFLFYVFSIIRIIDYVFLLLLAKKELGLNICDYLKFVVIPSFKLIVVFVLVACFFSRYCLATGLFVFILEIMALMVTLIVSIYLFLMNKEEKKLILRLVKTSLRLH